MRTRCFDNRNMLDSSDTGGMSDQSSSRLSLGSRYGFVFSFNTVLNPMWEIWVSFSGCEMGSRDSSVVRAPDS